MPKTTIIVPSARALTTDIQDAVRIYKDNRPYHSYPEAGVHPRRFPLLAKTLQGSIFTTYSKQLIDAFLWRQDVEVIQITNQDEHRKATIENGHIVGWVQGILDPTGPSIGDSVTLLVDGFVGKHKGKTGRIVGPSEYGDLWMIGDHLHR